MEDKKQEEKKDCPLCDVSEETLKKLKEAGKEKKADEGSAK